MTYRTYRTSVQQSFDRPEAMGDLHEVIAACADFGLAALFERMMNLPN